MKPYKFEPYLKTTLWGGYQIAPFKGIFTAQPNIGESWEISGVPGHESRAIERGLIDDVDVGLTLMAIPVSCTSNRRKMPSTIRYGLPIVAATTLPNPSHSLSTVRTLWCIA